MGKTNREKERAKKLLYVIVAVLAIATLSVRLLNHFEREQTALLFVGVPSLITLLMIRFSGTPKTSSGVAYKGVTIFLLMSSIVLGEGTVCIIMAAPIFYGMAAFITSGRRIAKKNNKDKLYSIAIIPALLLVAQPLDYIGETKIETVETQVVVDGTSTLDAFNASPDFMKAYPSFFKIGFPKPVEIKGEGIEVGDLREVAFKSTTKGIGVLTLRVIEKRQIPSLSTFQRMKRTCTTG